MIVKIKETHYNFQTEPLGTFFQSKYNYKCKTKYWQNVIRHEASILAEGIFYIRNLDFWVLLSLCFFMCHSWYPKCRICISNLYYNINIYPMLRPCLASGIIYDCYSDFHKLPFESKHNCFCNTRFAKKQWLIII